MRYLRELWVSKQCDLCCCSSLSLIKLTLRWLCAPIISKKPIIHIDRGISRLQWGAGLTTSTWKQWGSSVRYPRADMGINLQLYPPAARGQCELALHFYQDGFSESNKK